MLKLAACVALCVACCIHLQGQVVINELMYSPGEGVPEEAEYIELLNTGTETLDIAGWSFSAGVRFTFPPGGLIGAGQHLVIARDASAVAQAYGFWPNFVYTGKLDDGGELVRLTDSAGAVVDEVEYSDEWPWPVLPDGLGPSLEVIDPLSDNGTPRNWRAAQGGSQTPGRRNSVSAVGLPAWISKVEFAKKPSPGEAVEVTATVADAFTVLLIYRVNVDGEHSMSMTAAGAGAPGTLLYKATIPAQPGGSLVRFRVHALGPLGQNGYPRFDDTIQNTGYFVEDPRLVTQLPVVHWFIDPSRYERALEHAHTDLTEPAALVYDGDVYDSVQCRVRGGSARWWPKLHWKFMAAKSHDFKITGRLPAPVDRFNLQGSYSDKTYSREILSWESFEEAGVPANRVFHVRLHQNGKFFGLYVFLEQPDEDWLGRHGLGDEGAHYKADVEADASPASQAELRLSYEKENREWEDYTDLAEFLQKINGPDREARRRYLFDNVNIPAVINYLAVNVIIHNNDHMNKNYYLYRDTVGTGRWTMFPWDLDLTFGRNYVGPPYDQYGLVLNDSIWADVDVIPEREDVTPSHPLFGDRRHQKWDFLWNRLIDALLDEADIRQMYLRRLRTLMDLLLVPGKYESRIDALVPLFAPEAQQDAARWGQYGEEQSLAEAVGHLKEGYLLPRREHLFVTHRVPDGIPAPQSSTLRVVINEIMYAPTNGTDDEYIELFNCSFEESVDLSSWTIAEISLTVPPGTVILPRDRVLFAKKDTRFRQVYGSGLYLAGEYKGSLPDTGGTLTLANPSKSVIDTVIYSSQFPWPAAPGGSGPSLERADPDGPATSAASWAASTRLGGSPGGQNTVSDAMSFRSFIPLFTGSPWPMASLAFANAGEPGWLELKARTTTGASSTARRLLPANGQMAEMADELFPGLASQGWVEILGENRRVGSIQMLGSPSQLDGGSTFTVSSRTFFLAPVFSGPGAFRSQDAVTHVNLANPNDEPVTVRLRLKRGGDPIAEPLQAEKILPARGMLSATVSDLFGANDVLSQAYIAVDVLNGGGVIASHWVDVGGGSSLFCVPPQYPSASSRLFSAQFATVPGVFTEIVLLNQSEHDRRVTLAVRSETGLRLTLAGPISIGPGFMVRLDGKGSLDLSQTGIVGSLDIQSDGPGVSGCVIFGDEPGIASAAALPLQSEPFFREAVFSHLANGAGYYTGLAFYNPGNAVVTVRLTVFDHQAVKSGQGEFVLQPKTRKSALLHELVPSTTGQVRGFVHVAANGPVITQEIFADTATPRMSAVPPTPLR